MRTFPSVKPKPWRYGSVRAAHPTDSGRWVCFCRVRHAHLPFAEAEALALRLGARGAPYGSGFAPGVW